MKEVIKKIFNDYNFEERELPLLSENFLFAVNLSEDCLNFYLVLFIDNIDKDFLEIQVSEYYSAIKGLETGYDERMDKNLSMLVCLRNDDVTLKEELVKKVFEIEEDPYYFKKYVLTYKEEQYQELLKYFQENNIKESRTILNNIVNNIELFSLYKKEPNDYSNSLFNLCSKLLIKLPFIVFERDEKQMENLTEVIKKELNKEDLLNYSNRWLKLEEKDGVYNIHDILEVILEGEKNEL
ncbi:hypothetical protein AM499_02695 [Bacillus sp. FJAT-22090]|uniref:ABC-three component system middle component 1 n=1 Tax=Bacillus sp. FJAT-22090 TaxID=1581038 RepID=UPI0006AEA6D3|nr:ABC-three component system middle component 1 [Bacillus sp. FJAT-22090]ALC84842.1 hypothetical protein AM499_02695 [Bacillus sp. FJAT-22090]